MAYRAVPSFASESYFEALLILGTYIVCLFLFPATDRNRCTQTQAYKRAHT